MSKPGRPAPAGANGAPVPAAQRVLQQAAQALAQRRPQEAERALAGLLASRPDHAEALRLFGLSQQMRGQHARAVESFNRALAALPDDVALHMALGISLYESGQREPARAALERACRLAPDNAAAHFNLGRLLRREGADDAAGESLQRTLELEPRHLPARLLLAEVHTARGRIDEAARGYREILRRQPDHPGAWNGLANLKTVPLGEADARQLRTLFESAAAVPQEARVAWGFALARALEDGGHDAEAFDVLEKANTLKRRQLPWDASAHRAEVDAIMQACATPLATAAPPEQGHEVIFVVSLPRAGSSLVEQILASHPQVTGGNELIDLHAVLDEESARRGQPFPNWVAQAAPEDWHRLGQRYLERTAPLRVDTPRMTDKNLLNWHYVGVIRAMLPGARIVDCRRDPLESCVAAWRQLFTAGNNAFSYGLEDAAAYWRDYDRLLRHWRSLFPDHVMEHAHDALLDAPEARIRALLGFCELTFDPACLQFHRTERAVRTASAAQVRQPLYRSRPAAERYGDKLAPLRTWLAGSDCP